MNKETKGQLWLLLNDIDSKVEALAVSIKNQTRNKETSCENCICLQIQEAVDNAQEIIKNLASYK